MSPVAALQPDSETTGPVTDRPRSDNTEPRTTDAFLSRRVLFYLAPPSRRPSDLETRAIESDPDLFGRVLARLTSSGPTLAAEAVLGSLDEGEG